MAEAVNGYTVELVEAHGNDRLIAQAAWVCTGKDNSVKTEEDVQRVVQMLVREGHGSPLEMAGFTWLIRLDIASDRQLVTYRSAKRNGESMRYGEPKGDFQGLPNDVEDILHKYGMLHDSVMYEQACIQAHKWFEDAMGCLKERGAEPSEYRRVRECLRRMLPLATNVNRIIQMDLRSMANFLSQRLDSHAQPEIRGLAMQMLGAAMDAKTCPITIEALSKKGWKL
jgi:thymidylate synthase (FAD)